jgi:hypothetical protein
VGPGSQSDESVPDLGGRPLAPSSSGPRQPASSSSGSQSNASVAELEQKYGIKVTGAVTDQALYSLRKALALYSPSSVRGATINFPGVSRGSIGGTWEPPGRINIYQPMPHVIAHELAHHLIERNMRQFGRQLKQLLASRPGETPPTGYARVSRREGDYDEVAAEALSLFAEGRWQPQSSDLASHMQGALDGQAQATA